FAAFFRLTSQPTPQTQDQALVAPSSDKTVAFIEIYLDDVLVWTSEADSEESKTGPNTDSPPEVTSGSETNLPRPRRPLDQGPTRTQLSSLPSSRNLPNHPNISARPQVALETLPPWTPNSSLSTEHRKESTSEPLKPADQNITDIATPLSTPNNPPLPTANTAAVAVARGAPTSTTSRPLTSSQNTGLRQNPPSADSTPAATAPNYEKLLVPPVLSTPSEAERLIHDALLDQRALDFFVSAASFKKPRDGFYHPYRLRSHGRPVLQRPALDFLATNLQVEGPRNPRLPFKKVARKRVSEPSPAAKARL
ncbi:hypothetical protein FRC01_012413, partial [Tulasnella sp. 417]